MKYLIAPDSYKGSLSALQVAQAMKRGVLKVDPHAIVNLLPMADGGEGTVEALVEAVKGEMIHCQVTGPLGEPVSAFYGLFPEGKTAIIEMAAASGLPLVPKELRDPMLTTTFGTGELIRQTLDRGCTRLIIGIGGSATNDGGIGMAQALGYHFIDQNGEEIPFGGGSLYKIQTIDVKNRDPRLENVQVIVACDVDTVLCGERGASAVFAPQKGATSKIVGLLDQGLAHLADKIKETLEMDVISMPGGGAAGGLGAGLVAFLGATLKSGIEIVMDECGFDQFAQDADLVLTGEGNTDLQTVMGKTPVGVAKRAKQFQRPVICLSGGLGDGYQEIYQHGIDAAFSIMPRPGTIEEAFEFGAIWIEEMVESVVRIFSINVGK
ncbi:glycerate kinase [Fodinisporobacter ferrooxydans]|uniref:Glycerate kinase n=1 Tax=Fodinisporobacter ferrooxydans TaxID=2901836 RepID=A0ABY4CT00_9BACL|nr:glycerate kinase [Alicyclobacillaceae bacterium MYW30-H2]